MEFKSLDQSGHVSMGCHISQDLTWEKLKKRGMVGPSICQMCSHEEETMNHLLDSRPFVFELWDIGVEIFKRSNRMRGQLDQTIKAWDIKAFQIRIVSYIWLMFPKFLVWEVWNERNRKMFQDKRSIAQTVWSSVVGHIQETVKVTKWDEKDWDMSDQEAGVMAEWGLTKADQEWARGKLMMHLQDNPKVWVPPSVGYFKT